MAARIDRLTAGGFAAFWNAPLDDPSHAIHACEAANDMSLRASRVGEILAQQTLADGRPLPAVEIGIGVATGPLIAGAFGGHDRLGYSVHGEAVTLAQRIQALSHQYGPSVIVSAATAAAADRSFAFLEVDTVAAGRAGPAGNAVCHYRHAGAESLAQIPGADDLPRSYLPGPAQAAMATGAP